MTDAAKSHILVVDDEPMAVDLLVRFLSRRGYRVSTAVDGVDALTVCGQDKPDLVLTDLRMPRMDGLELIRRLRANRASVRIIAMTGNTLMGGDSDALSAGAEIVLRKPLKLSDLHVHIEKLLTTPD
jgi:CheY-like chemotaxis protein